LGGGQERGRMPEEGEAKKLRLVRHVIVIRGSIYFGWRMSGSAATIATVTQI